VQNDAFERVAFVFPGFALQRPGGVRIACVPALPNTRGAEIDVFGVVLVVEPRRKQPHDVHPRQAAIAGEILHQGALARIVGHELDQFGDNVTQFVHLPLTDNVGRDPARILDVFVAVDYFPDRLRLRSQGVPHVDGEDQRVLPRVVVEDRLGGRIGENAAVPIELTVDANGGKAGGNAPDAMMCFAVIAVSRLSK
jgi:hypothetical protein